MEQLKIFKSPQFGEIRTSGTSEEPLFCLADICKVLELQSGRVKQRLNQKGITLMNTLTEGGEQKMVFINEQNLYKVIMRSDKPQAEKFQDWVCGEVLPSIRKSGGYISTQQDETPEEIMAKALMVAQATIERKQKALERAKDENEQLQNENKALAERNEELKEEASYTADVLQSNTTYTLTQLAKDLGFSSIYKFYDFAKNAKILYRQSGQWIPTANFAWRGYFATRTSKYVNSNNEVVSSIYTVVTEKGRYLFHNIIKSNNKRA